MKTNGQPWHSISQINLMDVSQYGHDFVHLEGRTTKGCKECGLLFVLEVH